MLNRVFVGLGSNMGDRDAYLTRALLCLSESDGVQLEKVSSFYNTAAVSSDPQADYLNAVAEFKTCLDMRAFFEQCVEVETGLGRTEKGLYRPRTIDIDLLFFNSECVTSPDLVVPHPLLQDRLFVLEPFVEISPGFVHPVLNQSIKYLYDRYHETVNHIVR